MEQHGQVAGVVGAVGVQEDHNLPLRFHDPGPASLAVPPARLVDHARPTHFGNPGSAIAGAAIHHQDFCQVLARDGSQDLADAFGFVQSGDDNAGLHGGILPQLDQSGKPGASKRAGKLCGRQKVAIMTLMTVASGNPQTWRIVPNG